MTFKQSHKNVDRVEEQNNNKKTHFSVNVITRTFLIHTYFLNFMCYLLIYSKTRLLSIAAIIGNNKQSFRYLFWQIEKKLLRTTGSFTRANMM